MLRLGDYELLEEIARGGMGVVYRARQLSLNRVVAVKVVLHGAFSSPGHVRRFRTEAEATATLRHPNIVSVYEVGQYNGHHFLSMEYVEGSNLAELVREQPLPARQAAQYVKAIAEAVHHAHQRGVLHRDLKPSNILLDGFDQPRVTDFGLAKILDQDAELTASGEVLGSPNHMAPEQAAGDFSKITALSDIYSLGSILYQLLTGRPPFQGGTLAELLARVQTAEPVPPRQLNPSVPADSQSICLKCLQKEPNRRYASAQALADDIGRFLDQKPVLARPVSGIERAWLRCRRRPVLAALTGALALAVLCGLAGIIWQWRRAEFHAAGERRQRLAAEANAARTRLNLYAADAAFAAQAIQDGDYGLARRTLDDLRPREDEPDLRGFEWRYLWNLSRCDQLATLTGHKWIVTCATFSPDGKQIVTGGMSGEVRVWDVATHECLREFSPDTHSLWAASFTPDGKTLMLAGTHGIQFWNTETWRIINHFSGKLASLSGDGNTVAISESSPFYFEEAGAVRILNWRTGETLRQFSQPGRRPALSPDGHRLAVAGAARDILLWDADSGELLRTLPTERSVWSLNFSPDGRRLVSTGWAGDALVWDLGSDAAPHTISANHLNLWSVLFSPDGSMILTTSSDQTARLWDAVTLEPKAVLHGHANEVWCAAFSRDGKMLATGGKDQNVMLWQPEFAIQKAAIPYENESKPIFSPAGEHLFAVQPGGTARGKVWTLPAMTASAPFPAPGRKAAGFSRDGQLVAILSDDEGALEFWPAGANESSRRVKLRDAPGLPNESAISGMTPNMEFFYAADSTGVVRIWNAESGALIQSLQGPKPPIRNMVLSGRGRYLAASVERESTARFYDCDTGKESRLTGHKDFVSGLAFSPDETMLATGSVDGTIRLWDTQTGVMRAVLPGHMQETTDVAFSPDGRMLASLSQGESLKFWHVPTLREVYSEDMPLAGMWLQFSPDGQRLAVGTRNGRLRLLDAPKE